jgi:hypothetical protein
MPLHPARNTIEAVLMNKRRIGAEIMTDTNYPGLAGKVAEVTRGPEGIGAAASRTIEAKDGSPNNAAIARRNGSAGRCYTPTAGAAGSGRGKRPRKRSTASLSPSILISPERSASSSPRPS